MANNTIKLAVYGLPPVELEQTCALNVAPGMLLRRDAGGTIIPHDEAPAAGVGGFAGPKLIAVENIFEGKTINDTYVAWEKVWFIGARPGDVMWMWLDTGNTSAIGNLLVSAGNGYLDVDPGAVTYSDGAVIGTALDAIDASVGAARIKVEIA